MHGTQPDNVAPLRTLLIRATLALFAIAGRLSLRWFGFPLGLPAFVVKYGGSLLWATMVFLLVGVLLPRQSRMQIAAIAVVIVVVVEFLPADAHAMAGRIPAHHGRSAAARAHRLAVEFGGLRHWHRCRSLARSTPRGARQGRLASQPLPGGTENLI